MMTSQPPRLTLSPSLIRELQQCVNERVLTEDLELAPFAYDFGGIFHSRPAAVVSVGSEPEMCAILRVLRREQVPVTIRGSGYSCDGQSLGLGVVVQNRLERAPCKVNSETTVEVTGRTQWAPLVQELKDRWLSPPVLTYSLGPTAGGTLSAGGYGSASIVGGAQVDHVQRLRLILPDGEAVWCSPDEHAQLFRFALGGMGRVGYIERALMTTVPYRPLVHLVTREHADLQTLSDDILWMASASEVPDYFFAERVGGVIRSYYGYNLRSVNALSPSLTRGAVEPARIVPREFFCAFTHSAPAGANRCNVWCDYFVDAAALGPFLAFLEDGLRVGRLAQGLDRIHLLCIQPPAVEGRRAFRPLPAAANSRYYGVGVFFSAPAEERHVVQAARAAQRTLLEHCVRLGGRPYLCGAHSLDDRTIGAIFGEEYDELEALRDQLDPDHLFNRLIRE
jgi:FAD/FMN-containing dehydrogenase